MRRIFRAFPFLASLVAAGACVPALSQGVAAQHFNYQSTVQAPSGTQSVTAAIAVAPQAGGSTAVTLTVTGKPPMTVTLPAGGGPPPTPVASPSAQQAQGMLILERVGILAQLKAAKKSGGPLTVQIPVLPPGATQPVKAPATFTASGAGGATVLDGSASIATSAIVDPQKDKIKGVLPFRRIAQRAKNALTPSHVTVPDQATATVSATLGGGAVVQMTGNVTHALSANGQTTQIIETWSLKPAP